MIRCRHREFHIGFICLVFSIPVNVFDVFCNAIEILATSMILLRPESLVRSKATFYPELMLLYFRTIFWVLYPVAVAF